jgi:hypothetical protein
VAADWSSHQHTQPLETRKNQNKSLLQEDALMFLLLCEHLFTPQILPWLHVFLQPVKARSIAFTVAFPEQMC